MIVVATDAILVLVMVEAAALILFYRRTGRGIAPRQLLPNLAAGFSLMLAVRLASAGPAQGPASQATIGAVLFASLIAHLLDLAGRWRG